jgi:Ca2+-binding RTX toxin-like protein
LGEREERHMGGTLQADRARWAARSVTLLVVTAMVGLLVGLTPAWAVSPTCTYDSVTKTVTITNVDSSAATVTIRSTSDGKLQVQGVTDDTAPNNCNGQLLSAVDAINVTLGNGNDKLIIDQTNGSFGLSGTSTIDMASGFDIAQFWGKSPGSDNMGFGNNGSLGIRINGDRWDDPGESIRRLEAFGQGGGDKIDASGAVGGHPNPVNIPVRFNGGAGSDTLIAGNKSSLLVGGVRNDVLVGSPENDVLRGGRGDDRLQGLAGNDRLIGGPGDDNELGGSGNDVLRAGGGHNLLKGGTGRDRLFARNGLSDFVNGGRGRDCARWDAGLDTVRSIERVC